MCVLVDVQHSHNYTNVLSGVLVSLLQIVLCDDCDQSSDDRCMLLAHFTLTGSLILMFVANVSLEIITVGCLVIAFGVLFVLDFIMHTFDVSL